MNFPSILSVILIITNLFLFIGLILLLNYLISLKRSRLFSDQQKQQYKLMLNSAGEGIICLDIEGRNTFVNPSAAKMLGYEVHEILGQPGHQMFHHTKPDGSYYSEAECPIYASYKDGKIHNVTDEVFWKKDGTNFYVEYTSTPILEDGRLTGAVVTFKDITDRKKMEDALIESEKKFRTLFESAGDVICIHDLKGRFFEVNRTACERFGYTREELLSMTILNLESPENSIYMHSRIEELKKKKYSIFETTYVTKEGGHILTEVTSGLIEFMGEPAVLSIVRDITERKKRGIELEAIVKVATALRRTQTRAEMLPVLLDQLLILLDVSGASLAISDSVTGEIVFEIARGEWTKWTGLRLPASEGVSGYVMKTGTPYLNNDLFKEPLFMRPDLIGELRAAACVPLIAQNQTIGALWIGRKNYISDDEVRVLTAIGEIAANAIQRATMHEQTLQRLHRLSALHSIDMAITASLDLKVTLNILLDHVTAQLKSDAATVLLMDPHTQTLEYAAGRGFHSNSIQKTRLKIGEGHAGRAAFERRIVSIPNIQETNDPCVRGHLLGVEVFKAHHAAPLIVKGKIRGVLEIFHRKPLYPDHEWIEFLEALAAQAAIAIDNADLFNNLQQSNLELTLAYDATIEGWSRALDMRDRETEGHTQRVTEMSVNLARSMGINENEIFHIRRGALLHDIGKMGIPDNILNKSSPLNENEERIMRQHPVFAYELLWPIAFLRPAIDIPYCHHERWDGTGYPRGLKGEQIPLSARIFAVVDVWDALRSDRPYRKAWSEEDARKYIFRQTGKHFDPKVVESFFKLIDNLI